MVDARADGRTFVVVRFRGLEVVFARHTRANPGTSVDGVLESTSVRGDAVRYSLLALARGFSSAALDQVLKDLRDDYRADPQVLDRDDRAGVAVLRYSVSVRDLRSPGLQALSRFQHLFGVAWTRVEAGEVSMCGEAPGADLGRRTAAGIREALTTLGVDATVEVRGLSGDDLETYELLQDLMARFPWVTA